MKKYSLKELRELSIEYLQCPYCGAKLNRVYGNIPTSCMHCDKHGIQINEKKFILIDDLSEEMLK